MSTDNNMCTVKKRWVDVENPEVVKEYEKMAEDPEEVPWMAEYAKSKLDSYVYEDPNCHIRASPLFELFHIKLLIVLFDTIDFPHNNQLLVYGHIRLIDDKGNMFTLLKLDSENAKHVILTKDYNFPIIFEKPQFGTPRFLPKNFRLHIFLKDRIRNIVLFDNWKFFGFSGEVHYNDAMYYNVDHFSTESPRQESLLELGYTLFHCAVLASISVTLLNVENDDHQKMNLKLRALIKLPNSQVCHELFDDRPSKLKIGVPKELCVIAVPVYSPLKITASFNSDGVEDIVRELEFYPRDTHYDTGEKVEGQNYQMLVRVTWASASKTLPENYLREWDDAYSSSDSDTDIEIEINKGDIIKNPSRKKPFKVHHTDQMMGETCDQIGYFIQPQLEALDKRIWVVTSRPHEYVELFSVSIHSFDDAVSSSITGIINVYGLLNEQWDYFSGSEKKIGILYPSVTCKSLKGPNFGMEFDLEDAKGHQISRGYLDYNDRNVEAWYNRRVCSVVIGKCGYAAAYYTIFECGKQARLKIRLMMPENNNGVAVCVSGTIHARYSNYSYSTKYDKDYFQSTLFEEGKSESVMGGGELPLTKSVVAVPYNGSLIVKANLRVSIDGEHVQTLKGKVTFDPRNENKEDPKELKVISGSTSSSICRLSVNVVWGFPEFVQRCSTSSY